MSSRIDFRARRSVAKTSVVDPSATCMAIHPDGRRERMQVGWAIAAGLPYETEDGVLHEVEMPKIVKPPKPKRAKCDKCGATFEYLPEDVKGYGSPDSGGRAVACPRPTCTGHGGHVDRW